MKELQILNVIRNPEEDVKDLVEQVHEALPPPHRFPSFLVDFIFNGREYQMKMELELEGRDAEWNYPDGIPDDEMPGISEEAMNAIYTSKPWQDANKALDAAPASFWD